MDHPFLQHLQPTLHISHRGGAGLAPENTMVAFQLAAKQHNTDMIEIDIRSTADGELVVFHDADLGRTTNGVGAVAQHSLAEIRNLDAGFYFTSDSVSYPFRDKGLRIPLLRDVLEAFPKMLFNIELKDDNPAAENRFAAILREAEAVPKVCVGSEIDTVSKRLLQALPEACHFYPRNALINVVAAFKSGHALNKDDPYRVLDMPLFHRGMRLVDPTFLSCAAQCDRWVNVWTIDAADEMRLLIEQGVGGIMTDRPDVLRQVMKS